MKILSTLILFLSIQSAIGQVTLDADGASDTYALISSVLAPGQNPIETPDCSHTSFGDHIDQVFDTELDMHVFRFHIHTAFDDDRCRVFDRQRNEIKSYDQSPDNLKGIEDEKVVYKWKFKLSEGFQSSPNFTHIHQLKSVGGDYAGTPMYTLTARKGSPDQLELRYAELDDQITLIKTDIEPFIGNWVSVEETIEYGRDGTYEIEIKRNSDDEILFSYSNDDIINWQTGAEFVRPKWGIYRSLINAQDLRDETVLYANFSIEELGSTTPINNAFAKSIDLIYTNPASGSLHIDGLPKSAKSIQLISIDGRIFLEQSLQLQSEISLDISSIPIGNHIISIKGNDYNLSEKIVIIN